MNDPRNWTDEERKKLMRCPGGNARRGRGHLFDHHGNIRDPRDQRKMTHGDEGAEGGPG